MIDAALAGLHRTCSQGPFEANQLSLLEGLKPHLRRAAQINDRMEEIETAQRKNEAVLDQLSFAVMTVDSSGQVLSAKSHGREPSSRGGRPCRSESSPEHVK